MPSKEQTEKIKIAVSKAVSIKDLLRDDNGYVGVLIECPFHVDSKPSAKFHDDPDGATRLWCFSCRKQFTSYDLLVKWGIDPTKYLSSGAQDEIEYEQRELDYSKLDGYLKDDIELDDFMELLFNL